MIKAKRIKIYNKFNGHCAYCGKKIKYSQMQVDHLEPKHLAHMKPDVNNNDYENLMPSCQKCNIHKGGMMLKTWRKELALQVTRLRKNAQFDRALRFGQLYVSENPIIFYYEKYKSVKVES